MTTKFKPSIVHYASVSDTKMIIHELMEELSVFDDATNQKLIEMLNAKKDEIDSRYNR